MAAMNPGLVFYPDKSFSPVVVYSVEQWDGMTSFIVSRDFGGCATSLLDGLAPGLAEIAEVFSIEAHSAGDGLVKLHEARA